MAIKAFGDVIPSHLSRFYDFGDLNKVIERDNLSPDEVKEAYNAVLLDTLSLGQKTDIHGQLEYLFDEVKIPVNRVLKFVKAKFISLQDAILSEVYKNQRPSSSIIEFAYVFANPAYIGHLEITITDAKNDSHKDSIVLQLMRDQTEQERFDIFKSYLPTIQAAKENGDILSIILHKI